MPQKRNNYTQNEQFCVAGAGQRSVFLAGAGQRPVFLAIAGQRLSFLAGAV